MLMTRVSRLIQSKTPSGGKSKSTGRGVLSGRNCEPASRHLAKAGLSRRRWLTFNELVKGGGSFCFHPSGIMLTLMVRILRDLNIIYNRLNQPLSTCIGEKMF
jgi:hypothetical protein